MKLLLIEGLSRLDQGGDSSTSTNHLNQSFVQDERVVSFFFVSTDRFQNSRFFEQSALPTILDNSVLQVSDHRLTLPILSMQYFYIVVHLLRFRGRTPYRHMMA